MMALQQGEVETLRRRAGEVRERRRENVEEMNMVKVHGTGWCKVPKLNPTGRDENVLGYGDFVKRCGNAAEKYGGERRGKG